MASWKRGVARLGLELGYFTGIARLLTPKAGGIGVILKFTHVRPLEAVRMDPRQTVTPQFLDRLLGGLREWNFDIVSLDEVTQRLAGPPPPRGRRFVCLTFDGGYRDFLDHAWPLLARHDAPFALFVASNAPDGLADMWWLALEQVIRDNSRIGLMKDGQERRYSAPDLRAKQDLYAMLYEWLRSLPQEARTAAMTDLCGRYRRRKSAVPRAVPVVAGTRRAGVVAADDAGNVDRELSDAVAEPERYRRAGDAERSRGDGGVAGQHCYPLCLSIRR